MRPKHLRRMSRCSKSRSLHHPFPSLGSSPRSNVSYRTSQKLTKWSTRRTREIIPWAPFEKTPRGLLLTAPLMLRLLTVLLEVLMLPPPPRLLLAWMLVLVMVVMVVMLVLVLVLMLWTVELARVTDKLLLTTWVVLLRPAAMKGGMRRTRPMVQEAKTLKMKRSLLLLTLSKLVPIIKKKRNSSEEPWKTNRCFFYYYFYFYFYFPP
eukprot:Rmarinus@m.15346